MNYNMQGMEKTIPELFAMLKAAEVEIKEHQVLMVNKVWTLVDLPDNRQAIENKWIFKRKTDDDSSVTIYKSSTSRKKVF